MCNWHKHAIREAATDPATGEFHVGKYALGLTLMAALRIEQDRWNLAPMYEFDGFNPAELVTPEAVAAFRASGVDQRPAGEVRTALDHDVVRMRALMDLCADVCDLTPAGLNIADRITREGYKKTCCAPPDPRDNGPFLNAAVVYLYKGYDDDARSYASRPLELVDAEELEALQADKALPAADRSALMLMEGLRSAVAYARELPGTRELLEDTFSHAVSWLFQTAPADLAAHKGLKGPSSCVMCQGVRHPKPGE